MIECPKCKNEYDPCGCHEDDSGEQECAECGFVFIVEIEYDPSYTSSCKTHEYGDYRWFQTRQGPVEAKSCNHCGHVILKEAESVGDLLCDSIDAD